MGRSVGRPLDLPRLHLGGTACRADVARYAGLGVAVSGIGRVLAHAGERDGLAFRQGTQRLHEVVVELGLAPTLDERNLACVDDGEVGCCRLLGRACWLSHSCLSCAGTSRTTITLSCRNTYPNVQPKESPNIEDSSVTLETHKGCVVCNVRTTQKCV